MFLQKNARLVVGLCWILQDSGYADAVDVTALGAGEAFCRLPDALYAFRVGVRGSVEGQWRVFAQLTETVEGGCPSLAANVLD